MNKFDFIGVLRQYCNQNGICFIMGESGYVNAVADATVYENNELILVADLRLDVTFGGAVVQTTNYNGMLALGRKREIDEFGTRTVATLDETVEQKYDRRLKYLSEQLCNILKEITCENEGEIVRCSLRYDINQFDLNADFVAGDISINF